MIFYFSRQEHTGSNVGQLDSIGYSDWLSASCPVTIFDWRCASESACCVGGVVVTNKHTTFSLLQHLRIIRSPRDNATISSAIMIFQVMQSIVFNKHRLRLNKYRANTVHALFSSDHLWSFSHFLFWITGTRLAPPDVKETYCISRKCRTYTGSDQRGLRRHWDISGCVCGNHKRHLMPKHNLFPDRNQVFVTSITEYSWFAESFILAMWFNMFKHC